MNLPILITGGAGFIGSHLTDRLLQSGAAVRVLDDLSTGCLGNLKAARQCSNFEFVEGDAADADLVGRLASRACAVVHLAASVGVRQVVEAPGRTLRNNMTTTMSVVAAARAARIPLMFASTSEVYGRSKQLPFREDGELVLGPTSRGRWSYAAAKATGEWLALAEGEAGGFEVVVVRLFNTVGPRQSGRYGMVLPRFVEAARAGEEILVHGDGRQTRCFGHVGDVTWALEKLLERTRAGGLGTRVFNVGSDEEIAIGDLAERVRAANKSKSEIRNVPYDQVFGVDSGFEDMRRRVPSLEAIDRELGGMPRRGLDAIIGELLENQLV